MELLISLTNATCVRCPMSVTVLMAVPVIADRALDGVPASIDQLAEVVAEVKNAVPVYLDGGIRTGADVFKALVLGKHH